MAKLQCVLARKAQRLVKLTGHEMVLDPPLELEQADTPDNWDDKAHFVGMCDTRPSNDNLPKKFQDTLKGADGPKWANTLQEGFRPT